MQHVRPLSEDVGIKFNEFQYTFLVIKRGSFQSVKREQLKKNCLYPLVNASVLLNGEKMSCMTRRNQGKTT